MVTAPPYLLLYTFTRRQLFVSLSHSSYSIEYYLSGAHCQASNLFMFHNSITVFFSAKNAKSREIGRNFFTHENGICYESTIGVKNHTFFDE